MFQWRTAPTLPARTTVSRVSTVPSARLRRNWCVSYEKYHKEVASFADRHRESHTGNVGVSYTGDVHSTRRCNHARTRELVISHQLLLQFHHNDHCAWGAYANVFSALLQVGFGDLIPKRGPYLYFVLLYILIGLAITTMCIDLVGVQYIRKIHYFGRKLQDAKSAFAVVGGKVDNVECYAQAKCKLHRLCSSPNCMVAYKGELKTANWKYTLPMACTHTLFRTYRATYDAFDGLTETMAHLIGILCALLNAYLI